jgi:hypothetical protein
MWPPPALQVRNPSLYHLLRQHSVSPDFNPITEAIPLSGALHDCGEALEKSLKVLDFIRVQLVDVNTKSILELCPCQESDGSGKENQISNQPG